MGSKIETLYKLMDSNIEALEFTVSPDFTGVQTPLKNLSFKDQILIAGIIRKRRPFIPTGDDMILAGDRVVVLCSGHRMNDITDILK